MPIPNREILIVGWWYSPATGNPWELRSGKATAHLKNKFQSITILVLQQWKFLLFPKENTSSNGSCTFHYYLRLRGKKQEYFFPWDFIAWQDVSLDTSPFEAKKRKETTHGPLHALDIQTHGEKVFEPPNISWGSAFRDFFHTFPYQVCGGFLDIWACDVCWKLIPHHAPKKTHVAKLKCSELRRLNAWGNLHNGGQVL